MMDPKSELDKAVNAFMTYEDYLDSMLTKDDLMFLEDKEMCRDLLVLGYHSNKRIIPKEAFDQRKAQKAAQTEEQNVKDIRICGSELQTSCNLMQALAKREEDNLTGCLATIIFIRDINEKGEEVSAYIDYRHRLRTEDWIPYFRGEKKIVPSEKDLSFYNWVKGTSYHTSSANFEVVPDTDTLKLIFICTTDRYVIDVNPKTQTTEKVFRLDLADTNYEQAAIFDHVVDSPIP
ncbi:cilia- and flagella-associated protein 299-like isoform X2 [Argiope bruennichi]|uniref:Cilia- and flagella-associated protein 299 n=2 Tax=Argiope bruennichi TaxID=94029 RepID=A0A8T0E738_ARGBR|nr:cilia- and flagella-associated protein 299-like isoform X2 [Argiope bruennichi]XP_055940408.1 cilia- and flagella-associated protein 299-like isoform X2 [Argiope bruennichi]KAF8765014.1 Cilia- and flagella-associated protein 299 like protein [Argiope bruennichi]